MKNSLIIIFAINSFLLIALTISIHSMSKDDKAWVYENSNDTIFERLELISSKDILKSKSIKFNVNSCNLKTNYKASISGIAKLSQEIVEMNDSIDVAYSGLEFRFKPIEISSFKIDVLLEDAKRAIWIGNGFVDGKNINLGYCSVFNNLYLKENKIIEQKTTNKNSSSKSVKYNNSDKEFSATLELENLKSIIESKSIKFTASKLCNKTNFKEEISGVAIQANLPAKILNEKGDSVEALNFIYKPTDGCSMSIYFDKETQKICTFNSFGCVGGNKIFVKEWNQSDGSINVEEFDSGEGLLKLKE